MNPYTIIEYVRDSIGEQRDLLTDIEEEITPAAWKLVSIAITQMTECIGLLNDADKRGF